MPSPTIVEEQTTQKKYRVLMVTGIYPTPERPHKGTFVKPIVDALLADGHTVDIVHPNPGHPTLLRYLSAMIQVLSNVSSSSAGSPNVISMGIFSSFQAFAQQGTYMRSARSAARLKL